MVFLLEQSTVAFERGDNHDTQDYMRGGAIYGKHGDARPSRSGGSGGQADGGSFSCGPATRPRDALARPGVGVVDRDDANGPCLAVTRLSLVSP